MNRMTELLERINYDLPGLKKAKMCYAQGDADGAMDAVIEHFRTRITPKYLFTAKEMEQCKVDGILEDAQETLDHYIYGHKFDGEIDWFFNPTEHTSHDNEWTWSLYRHIYWQPLARAYALTKDEKYTKEFLHEMTEWGKAWPVAPFMENEEDAAAKYKIPGSLLAHHRDGYAHLHGLAALYGGVPHLACVGSRGMGNIPDAAV